MSLPIAEFLLARIAEDEATLWALFGDYPTGREQCLFAGCEARRRLVEDCRRTITDKDGYYVELDVPEAGAIAERHLRLLAQPYAGHPDYDPAWCTL